MLINLGFEHRLQELYQQFEIGEISLGYLARELGLGIRNLYAVLEERGLPTSNIGARSSSLDGLDHERRRSCGDSNAE